MVEADLELRRAHGWGDYTSCVELQKGAWFLATSDDMAFHVASTAILKIAIEHGGLVLIAEDAAHN